jgi:hypothetical protein
VTRNSSREACEVPPLRVWLTETPAEIGFGKWLRVYVSKQTHNKRNLYVGGSPGPPPGLSPGRPSMNLS